MGHNCLLILKINYKRKHHIKRNLLKSLIMNIDISNIKKERREKEKDEETEIETRTQIRLHEQVVSLLELSERIKSSASYSSSATLFDIVVRYDFIKEISGRKVMETSNIKQKHVILFYEFRDHIDFNELLFGHLTTPKLLVLHVVMSYKMLLESLLVLEQMNISFSSFSSNNLIFEKKTYKPVITQLEDASISSSTTSKDCVAKEAVNELYGNIIQSIIVAFSLENTILNDFTEREDLLRKMDKLDKWDFVREMNPAKMTDFRKELLNY
jgi:hypothetical protein